MDPGSLVLTPALATLIFCVTCLAGHRYRRVWKSDGPRHQYWIYGMIAAAGLIALGFIPISGP